MNNNENATAAYYYKNKETGTIAGQGFWLKPVEQLLEIIQKNNDENKDNKTCHAITDPDILAVLIRFDSRSPVGCLRAYLGDISRDFRDCMRSLESVEETVSSIEEIIHADKDCDWKIESIDNMGESKFSTSCGSSFYCGTEDPDKSGFKFCPKCGREIYVRQEVK